MVATLAGTGTATIFLFRDAVPHRILMIAAAALVADVAIAGS
ncbi:hypothetical protein [Rhodococcus opacus]|nr:hypothetical protein [Rhodococcus opacus]